MMIRTTPTTFPPPGSILELFVGDCGVDGGGVARHDGGVVFLDRGLPGETVRARLERIKTRHAFAVVRETLVPSPHERPSFCGHAPECGGCAWTTLDYAAECAWKDRRLRETLRRVGGLPRSFTEDEERFPALLPSPAPLRYRNKMEFAFTSAPESPAIARLGLRRRNSHNVTEIAECALSAQPVAALLEAVRAWVSEYRLPAWQGGTGFLRFLITRNAGAAIVELVTAPCPRQSPHQKAVLELARVLLDRNLCTGFIHSLRADPAPVAYGETTRFSRGRDTAMERYGALTLRAPAGAFLQINSGAAALLYATAARFSLAGAAAPQNAARGARILDLYAGVGGIALSLAGLPAWSGASVAGFESVKAAVMAARDNARLNNGPYAAFCHGDAAALLATEKTAPDLLVADPPRAGLGEGVLREILRLGPKRLILVSCNPATLARDAARLSTAYAPALAQGLDLFPRTPHLEAALLLEQR